MPDPFRLRVLKAITTQLKTTTPANGYVSDLSDYTDDVGRTTARVFRGRDSFGFSDGLPLVSVLEDPQAKDAGNAGGGQTQTTGKWHLLVQGFCADDSDNPTDDAYTLCADTIIALAKAKKDKFNILGLGGKMPCVTNLEIGQPVVRPADNDVSSVAFFFLRLTLTLAEDLEKPYA
jgi:hypothetical protein